MDIERREALQSLAAIAAMATTTFSGKAVAQVAPMELAAQPFAKLDSGDKPVRGGTLRLAAPQYIGFMNPNRWPVNDWVNMAFIHQKLLVTDGAYRPTVPFVAESVVRESPTSALVTLRDGIRYHDGTPLNAEALKDQIAWIREPANAAFTISWLANLDTVEVVTPLKLRWKFKQPWAAFEGNLANVPGYMLSPKALKADAKRFETVDPKGIGPYMVEDASPGNYLRLKRNPDYWLGKVLGRPDMPYHDGILISVIPDPAIRLASFRAGKLDILGLDKSQYATVKDDKTFDTYVIPVNTTIGLRINAVKGPCADIRVRRAIRHAVDVKALIQGTQRGLGRIASGLFPGDHWAHNPDLKPAEFNPQLAKSLLAQAGLDKGLDIKGYVDNSTASVEVSQAIKYMLAQVGINWQVDALSPVAADARRKSLDWDMASGGWVYIYDPDLPMTGLYSPKGSFPEGRADSPARTAMIEAARQEASPDKRQVMYRELEKLTNDDASDLWLWWEESATAYQKWVRGYDNKALVAHKESYFVTHTTWFANGKPG